MRCRRATPAPSRSSAQEIATLLPFALLMTRLGEALTVLVTLQAATVIHLKRQPESAFGRDGGSLQLRHLRYFVKIVEAGSFSRAAATIHVAQPALSQQIAELEEELGVALLQRHARGIAGSAFPSFWEAAAWPAATATSTICLMSPRKSSPS
jgi:hypothetical protein